MSIAEIAPTTDVSAVSLAPAEDQGEDTIMADDPSTANLAEPVNTDTNNSTNNLKPSASPPAELTKSHLPASLASLIPQTQRTPKEQETFLHRKAEIMHKFSLAQIQALYEEETAKVLAMLEEDRRSNEEVKKQIEILEKQRGLERKIYSTMRGGKGKLAEKEEEDAGKDDADEDGLAKGEEGEVLEDGEDVKMEGGE